MRRQRFSLHEPPSTRRLAQIPGLNFLTASAGGSQPRRYTPDPDFMALARAWPRRGDKLETTIEYCIMTEGRTEALRVVARSGVDALDRTSLQTVGSLPFFAEATGSPDVRSQRSCAKLGVVLLYWLRKFRRRRLVAQPLPSPWISYLRKNMAHYAALDARERATLHSLVNVFLEEKSWEGCDGLTLDDEIKVTIAGQACLLLLGRHHDLYCNVHTILVYPGSVVPREPKLRAPAFGEIELEHGETPLLGQAFMHGPVILTWDAVLRDSLNEDGHNVVYHEFAHKLDMLDGDIDGIPAMPKHDDARRWFNVLKHELATLRAQLDRGAPTILNQYAATDVAELFAVATEHFFETPIPLQRGHPEFYGLLQEFYKQDPAARARRVMSPTDKESPTMRREVDAELSDRGMNRNLDLSHNRVHATDKRTGWITLLESLPGIIIMLFFLGFVIFLVSLNQPEPLPIAGSKSQVTLPRGPGR